MSRDLLIAASPGEVWAALVEDGELATLRVLRPGRGGVGEVILGRVVALRPELPAALVDIGLDRPAFLSAEDAEPGAGIANLHEGAPVIVQITKDARADKAAGVSMRPRLAGRFLDLTPMRPGVVAGKGLDAATRERLLSMLHDVGRPGEGIAIRAAAAGATREDLAADLDMLRRRWQAIGAVRRDCRPPARLETPATPMALLLGESAPSPPDAIIVDDRAAFAEARAWLARHRPELAERLALHRSSSPLFEEHGVAGEIAAVLAPRVTMAGGGALVIEPTAAATMIDVDSGSGGRGNQAAEAALAVNLGAAREAARQIRLRNLAGPIVIDFIGMRSRGHRDRVREALAAALAGDGDAEVLGWTRLGHFELVRKRRHAPLAEVLFERVPGGGLVKTPLTVALEVLRALARQADATPGRPPSLHVHPEVAAVLDGDAREGRLALEARLGRPLAIVAEPGRARDAFDIRLG